MFRSYNMIMMMMMLMLFANREVEVRRGCNVMVVILLVGPGDSPPQASTTVNIVSSHLQVPEAETKEGMFLTYRQVPISLLVLT